MKKIILFLCIVCSVHFSYAQENSFLNETAEQLKNDGISPAKIFYAADPPSSNIQLQTAAQYILYFQNNNDHNFPVSFLMDVSDLTKYLKSKKFDYIHIYNMLLDKPTTVNPTPSTLLLALTPVGKTLGFRQNKDFKTTGNYYVFSNPTPCPCGIAPDDQLDPKPAPQNPPPFAAPNGDLLAVAPAQAYILNYQTAYKNTQQHDNYYPETFIINADKLKSFLTDGNSQNPPNSLAYIQIYLGKDKDQANLSDAIKLIIVGVDNTGHHVYFTDDGGNTNYVLEEVLPCPVCGITRDNKIDHDTQYFSNKIATAPITLNYIVIR